MDDDEIRDSLADPPMGRNSIFLTVTEFPRMCSGVEGAEGQDEEILTPFGPRAP